MRCAGGESSCIESAPGVRPDGEIAPRRADRSTGVPRRSMRVSSVRPTGTGVGAFAAGDGAGRRGAMTLVVASVTGARMARCSGHPLDRVHRRRLATQRTVVGRPAHGADVVRLLGLRAVAGRAAGRVVARHADDARHDVCRRARRAGGRRLGAHPPAAPDLAPRRARGPALDAGPHRGHGWRARWPGINRRLGLTDEVVDLGARGARDGARPGRHHTPGASCGWRSTRPGCRRPCSTSRTW